MTSSTTSTKAAGKRKREISIPIGFAAVFLFFVASGYVSYVDINSLLEDNRKVSESHDIITESEELLDLLKDAETGQRGFLLTGRESYLAPYENALTAIPGHIEQMERDTKADPTQAAFVSRMKPHPEAKLAELAKTIQLRRTSGLPAALRIVLADYGKREMDEMRTEFGGLLLQEKARRDRLMTEMENANRSAIAGGILTCLFGLVLTGVIAGLVSRAARDARRQEWLQEGQVGLSATMFGDQRIEELGDNILRYLAEYLHAQAGAIYASEGEQFRRIATYGIPSTDAVPMQFNKGEGILGQAAADNRRFILSDVPDGYLRIGSALGESNPRYLVVTPGTSDDVVNAVIELGAIHPLDELSLELLTSIAGSVGIAVRSAFERGRIQNLLEETQAQGEELQAQSEELRVSNEELEEQSRALRESQMRLEQQQVELEQTNSQLEEQAQILENQRDDLSRMKDDLEEKAKDLESTSRYKTDFLANMSHELRTPLNSSLILAKLLKDNRTGNLTAEQIKYAATIESAGNDLLSLISDILDLSKIEAGQMDVEVQRVRLDDITASLRRTFDPIASDRSLQFRCEITPRAPEYIETDSQRLEQVLKNLLSNAMKFTERGEVVMTVDSPEPGLVAFSVTDTGIGIAEHQQQMVFEAFRQADGTTNRKFGGTGLGLSISQELAHLLGGEVTLTSTLGIGSTFTLTVPAVLVAADRPSTGAPPGTVRRPASAAPLQKAAAAAEARPAPTPGVRLILVVEDDATFAGILADVAREHGFQSLVASTAEEGVSLAIEHRPDAVLLDIGLPDNSGLTVLDRLKHDGRTRHIPVHVVSATDKARTAMELGAVGYMMKPVKRDDLIAAFDDLQTMLAQRLKRVLVVEDDPTQMASLRLLLDNQHVETIGVGSAAECLRLLESGTFDCMVLDLSLPDASGFSLLETISQGETYAFPPVIVYTGRDLNQDEEQRLRKYSKSIIVKGAKSPERLLDEVTLFLHQVVSELPAEKQKLIETAKSRDADLENRRILVVEDDIRNIFALTSILEPRGAKVEIARNGKEALALLDRTQTDAKRSIELVLMDIMMPEMDGLTAMREIRKRPEWRKLPIIALTAKAMRNDQEACLNAGANDYIAKPLDVEKLLSLVRVWMPRE